MNDSYKGSWLLSVNPSHFLERLAKSTRHTPVTTRHPPVTTRHCVTGVTDGVTPADTTDTRKCDGLTDSINF